MAPTRKITQIDRFNMVSNLVFYFFDPGNPTQIYKRITHNRYSCNDIVYHNLAENSTYKCLITTNSLTEEGGLGVMILQKISQG